MKQFSQTTKEVLKYYVYILVDPSDNKIFYIGKGKDNRVFDHVACSINEEYGNEKLELIRKIHKRGEDVKHFIIRHDLAEATAYIVESVLIDLLTYSTFPDIAKVSNIAAGHHQWFKGIKTVEEIEMLYSCQPLQVHDIMHNIMTININTTYNINNERHPNIYESTRKSWRLSERRIQKVEFVMSEYKGIIRAIFKPTRWIKDGNRFMFEGEEITDKRITDIYLHKSVPPKKLGNRNPIKYFNKTDNLNSV